MLWQNWNNETQVYGSCWNATSGSCLVRIRTLLPSWYLPNDKSYTCWSLIAQILYTCHRFAQCFIHFCHHCNLWLTTNWEIWGSRKQRTGNVAVLQPDCTASSRKTLFLKICWETHQDVICCSLHSNIWLQGSHYFVHEEDGWNAASRRSLGVHFSLPECVEHWLLFNVLTGG